MPNSLEFEPKGEGMLVKIREVLELGGIPNDERVMAEHSLLLCEQEFNKEGQVSKEGLISLSDFYEKYRPKTEAEIITEIQEATESFKSTLRRREYPQDDIDAMSEVFSNLLETVLTGDKLRNPDDILQKFFELYG